MAKEKEVSGVKDAPKEDSAEGRDDSEASRQPAENGHSDGDHKARKVANAEPAGENSEAVAAAGEGCFCIDEALSLHDQPRSLTAPFRGSASELCTDFWRPMCNGCFV